MLLAQSASTPLWLFIAIAVVVVSIVVGLVILILVMRHLAANRKLLHDERMRAVELGQPMEPPDPTKMQEKFMHNAFWISFWIVVCVPSAAFSAVAATTTERSTLDTEVAITMWVGASLASVAAVVCATLLMIRSRSWTGEDLDGKAPPKRIGKQ